MRKVKKVELIDVSESVCAGDLWLATALVYHDSRIAAGGPEANPFIKRGAASAMEKYHSGTLLSPFQFGQSHPGENLSPVSSIGFILDVHSFNAFS